jgi:phosphoesterase RecJ-like protein
MRLIKEILAFINKHQRFLITAHARPDGDALGSELALALFLKKMGKNVRIVHQNDIPSEYNFLPGRKMVEEISGPVTDSNLDAIFILDSDGLDRLEKLAGYIPLNLPTVNIDHHPSNNHFGVINWADGSMSSVGEMVYRLIKASEVPIDKNIAINLYVSLMTDTGNFCYASTTPSSHLMASDLLRQKINLTQVFQKIYKNLTLKDLALRCDCTGRIRIVAGGKIAYTELTRSMFRKHRTEPRDTQQYFDLIRSIKGVKISLLFRESKNKGEGVKVGIRTEPPINASKLALVYGGGGHYRAAGCTIYKPLREAQKIIVKEAEKFIQGK